MNDSTTSRRPPYDSGLARALDDNPTPPDLSEASFAEWRAMNPMDMDLFDHSLLEAGVAREELTIPGPRGRIELTILKPSNSEGALSALIYIHGGGMVAGDRYSNVLDLNLHGWVRQLGLAVISVEYRLAPEFPAPAGVEDCYAAIEWVANNALHLGIDSNRIIVAGISGGGALAAGAAQKARDKNGPCLMAQMLICPMLDDRNLTASASQYAIPMGRQGSWPTENNARAWDAVLGAEHADREVDQYSAPARAADLSGLPPTYLDAGSAEVFRDEIVEYASRLWAGGSSAELHVWSGGFHSFDLLAPSEPISVQAHAARFYWLERILKS